MTASVRRGILWIALFTLVAILIRGITHEKLLQQGIWTHAGIRRFLIFAAGYALFCIALCWKPEIFTVVAGLFALGYTVVAVGPIAVLVVAMVLLSSLALGHSIVWRRRALACISSTDWILAMLCGLSIYILGISLAAYARINFPLVYLAALAIPLIGNWRAVAHLFRGISALIRPPRLSWSGRLACAALLFVLLAHWLVALQPEVGPDALAMHLAIPDSMAWLHRWSFDVNQHIWAVMPMNGDWAFTLCYLLGGEAAARLFNFALLLLIVALLGLAIGKWLPPAPSLLITALFAATPLVQLVTGSLFVENLWAVLLLGCLVSIDLYRQRDEPRYLYLAFALLGSAVATKFGALAFVAPLILVSLWPAGKRQLLTTGLRRALLAAVLFLALAAPPYLSALAKTRDPVFPYMAKIFPTRYPAIAAGVGMPPPGQRLGLRSPYDLTFHTSLFYEVQDGATGFQYFLLLPLGLLLLGRKWPPLAIAGGVTFAAAGVLTLITMPDARYLYPTMPPATLFIAGAFAALERTDRWLYRVVTAAAVATFLVDLYFLPASNWMHKDFVSNPVSTRARQEYLTAYAPERHLIDYLNRAHPGDPVAFFESNAGAGLRAPAFTTSWHTVEFNNRVSTAGSQAECLEVLRNYGVRFVIAPQPASGIPITTTAEEAFLKDCLEPELTSGKFYAGRVKPCAGVAPLVASPGEYDDADERIQFHGQWSRGRFPRAWNGTIAYSANAGANLELRFNGAEVIYVYTKAFNRGLAEISLDGASQGTLDLYSSSIEWRTATAFHAPGPGPHTLEIRVSGRKNPAATGVFVDLDELIVRP